MKKRIWTLLAICSLLFSFSACSIPEMMSSEGESKTSEHEHEYEWVAYEEVHQKVYTCGCPYPDIAEFHIDNDENNICDVCEYSLGELPTPTNHFLRNQAGAEWLQNLEADDVAEVKLISQAVGVAPGALKTIQSSDDFSAISKIVEACCWMDTAPISKAAGAIDGGSSLTVVFTLTTGEVKELYFNNGNYCDSNGNYFELLYTPTFGKTKNYTEYYGFITYNDVGTVWLDGVVSEPGWICEIAIDDLEFCILNEDINIAPTDNWYIVNTSFFNLRFLSNRLFYNPNDDNRVYYKLVGKDLDELIAEALSNYSVTMNDEAWLWEELQPTYKAGETVSVKIGMALDVGYMFLVNGEQIATCNDVNGLYWEFTFTMPACDVVIDFKTYDGFLPDANYAVLIETYWLQNLNAESVSVRRYYGEFENGAIVAMMHVGHFDDVVWSESVNGLTFQYYDSDRINVLYDGTFYTLTEAYERGFISAEALAEIAELHAKA